MTLELKEFKQSLKFVQEVGNGFNGFIYRVTPRKVAKILYYHYQGNVKYDYSPRLRWDKHAKRELEHQFEVTKELYNSGVSVPKPYGVFLLSPRTGIKCRDNPVSKDVFGFVMEYIPGRWANKEEDSPEVREQIEIELEKVKRLGYFSEEIGENNILVCKNRVFLIDFEDWTKTPLRRIA